MLSSIVHILTPSTLPLVNDSPLTDDVTQNMKDAPYNGPDCPHEGGCIYKPYSLTGRYCGSLEECKKKAARKTDCETAFRNYFCFLNFPRCDDENKTLPMCRSACINLMRACKYSADMMRCGPSEFHNVSCFGGVLMCSTLSIVRLRRRCDRLMLEIGLQW